MTHPPSAVPDVRIGLRETLVFNLVIDVSEVGNSFGQSKASLKQPESWYGSAYFIFLSLSTHDFSVFFFPQ